MDSARVYGGLTLAQVVNLIAAVFAAAMWFASGRGVPAGDPAMSAPGGVGEAVAPPDAGGSHS
jgi:hypothetical protein